MKWLDELLNKITMYRLLLYYLIALLLVALVLGLTGGLHYDPLSIVASSLFLVAVCRLANHLFAYVFKAPTNVESVYITALILALIITPARTFDDLVFLAAAGGLAVASKYILAIKTRHIFNPAAIAVVLTSVGAAQSASWWVGSAVMLPYVIVGGLLLIRKLRRFTMVGIAIGVTLVATSVYTLLNGGDVLIDAQNELMNSPMFFAMIVMLTEPFTSPTNNTNRAWYAALVGALFPPQVHIGSVYSTPELALVMGNIFSYIVGPRAKTMLHLKQRTKLTPDTMDFAFTPVQKFNYKPGQYMEFTLQHPKTDSRGARRYFTIASSPTEPELHLGLKFYPKSSSYKRAFINLADSDMFMAAQLSGDFVLPKDSTRKLAFIAGGIGITPYRSMVKYLLDTNQRRDIAMLYSARTASDFAYREIFDQAKDQLGLQVNYLTGSTPAQPGDRPLSTELIKQLVPDFAERLFYISGPHGMVVATEKMLRQLGVRGHNIKKDFFSGYA